MAMARGRGTSPKQAMEGFSSESGTRESRRQKWEKHEEIRRKGVWGCSKDRGTELGKSGMAVWKKQRGVNRWKSRNKIKVWTRKDSPYKGARKRIGALLPMDLGGMWRGSIILGGHTSVCQDCFQTCSPLCPTHSCCTLAHSKHLNQVQAQC